MATSVVLSRPSPCDVPRGYASVAGLPAASLDDHFEHPGWFAMAKSWPPLEHDMRVCSVYYLLRSVYLCSFVFLVCPPTVDPQDLCKTPKECNKVGTSMLKDGKVEEAIRLFEHQVVLAEIASYKNPGDLETVLVGYNNLALAHIKKGEHLRALAWTKVALSRDDKNKAALYHMKLLEEKLKSAKEDKGDVTGTYKSYVKFATWNTLTVSKLPDHQIQFSLEAWHIGRPTLDGEIIPNEGYLEGTASLNNNEVVYVVNNRSAGKDSTPCKIVMRFEQLSVQVDQEGSWMDCGFGGNVYVGGEYTKVSS